MRGVCFCGRSGDVRDREPILDEAGRWALRCIDCGHTDYLEWLSEEAGLALWGEAKRRAQSATGSGGSRFFWKRAEKNTKRKDIEVASKLRSLRD